MTDTDPILNARRKVITEMFKMRYSGSISTPAEHNFVTDSTEDEFLDAIASWLHAFNLTLGHVAETTQNMSDELDQLRRQRKAVRDFLGLTDTERPTP